ncbi:hypothetical protein Tco_0054305 [Tanacetum coccineum]
MATTTTESTTPTTVKEQEATKPLELAVDPITRTTEKDQLKPKTEDRVVIGDNEEAVINLQAGGEYKDKDKDFKDIRRSPYNDKDTEDILKVRLFMFKNEGLDEQVLLLGREVFFMHIFSFGSGKRLRGIKEYGIKRMVMMYNEFKRGLIEKLGFTGGLLICEAVGVSNTAHASKKYLEFVKRTSGGIQTDPESYPREGWKHKRSREWAVVNMVKIEALKKKNVDNKKLIFNKVKQYTDEYQAQFNAIKVPYGVTKVRHLQSDMIEIPLFYVGVAAAFLLGEKGEMCAFIVGDKKGGMGLCKERRRIWLVSSKAKAFGRLAKVGVALVLVAIWVKRHGKLEKTHRGPSSIDD